MNIKNITRIILLTTVIFTCGCTQYLELNPLNKANGEQVWGTADGCRKLLAGSYSRLRASLLTEHPFYMFGDLPSDMILTSNTGVPKELNKGNFLGDYLLWWWGGWQSYYEVIGSCNTLLKHINDVPDTDFSKDAETGRKEKKRIEAEAGFVCAYTYFYMVRLWGDVPLIKEAIESVDQALDGGSTIGRAQAPEIETLEYCLKRLDAAIVNLDYDKPGDATWAVRADKSSALALKAHVSLWLANSYKGTARYRELVESAESCLSTVIIESNRTLCDYSNQTEVTKMFNGKGPEGIFELNVSVDDNESFWLNDNYYWPIHSRTYWREEFKDQIGVGDLIVADAVKSTTLYPVKDVRRKIFFENLGNANADPQFPPVLLKYSTGMQEDANNPGRYYANSNISLLRLTDVVLLRAEALYKLGRLGNARSVVNEIRNRAGIGNFTGGDGELLKAIMEERARELVGEGQSYYDRIRNDYWEGADWMSDERKAKKGYYQPIYMDQLLSANRDLKQVPWWVGKQ